MSFDSVIEDLWRRHLQTLDPAVAATRFRRDWYYRAWFGALDLMDILDGNVQPAIDVCIVDDDEDRASEGTKWPNLGPKTA